MGSITWGPEIAEVYDQTYAAQSATPVLGPMVDLLAELARGGPALEFAAGTGRVALPLAARGIAVHGIELSPHMAERMAAKPGAGAVPVTIGDMTSTRVLGIFRLVYLVANTIMNVTTQDHQLAVFGNAAAHLEPGGCFVVEVEVPQLRRVPPGETAWVFTLSPDHVGIETFDDTAAQIAWSRHWIEVEGAAGAPLRALPVRVAVRAGPDGQDHRFPGPSPLGGLGPGAIHLRQHQPSRSLRETAAAAGTRRSAGSARLT